MKWNLNVESYALQLVWLSRCGIKRCLISWLAAVTCWTREASKMFLHLTKKYFYFIQWSLYWLNKYLRFHLVDVVTFGQTRQALSPYFQSWCCDKLTGCVAATYVSMLSIFSTETLPVFSTLWWHHKGSWSSSRTTKDITELCSVVLNDRLTHSLCNKLRCFLWSCLNVDDNITNKVLHFVLDWTGPMVLTRFW